MTRSTRSHDAQGSVPADRLGALTVGGPALPGQVPAAAPTPARPTKPALEFEGSAREGHRIVMQHEGALSEVFGTHDDVLATSLLNHCLKVLGPREAGDTTETEDERAFMLSAVNDLAPRDAVERMLAVQMAATHVALIRSAGSLARADILPRIEAHSTAYNKLARTFAAQVEALRKHRTGGRQTVVVQHVTVADGGQAIFGHVQTGTRDQEKDRGVGG